MKSKISSVIRLNPEALVALGEMMKELSVIDPELILNSSKLVSYLLLDFQKKQFDKSKSMIAHIHRNKRKDAQGKLSVLSEVELDAVIKYLSKIKKVDLTDP